MIGGPKGLGGIGGVGGAGASVGRGRSQGQHRQEFYDHYVLYDTTSSLPPAPKCSSGFENAPPGKAMLLRNVLLCLKMVP